MNDTPRTNERKCHTCSAEIPDWWVRDYCANCGEGIPQTAHQAEIARLQAFLQEIDDVTGFDYPTMPETSRAKSHEIVREIITKAFTKP